MLTKIFFYSALLISLTSCGNLFFPSVYEDVPDIHLYRDINTYMGRYETIWVDYYFTGAYLQPEFYWFESDAETADWYETLWAPFHVVPGLDIYTIYIEPDQELGDFDYTIFCAPLFGGDDREVSSTGILHVSDFNGGTNPTYPIIVEGNLRGNRYFTDENNIEQMTVLFDGYTGTDPDNDIYALSYFFQGNSLYQPIFFSSIDLTYVDEDIPNPIEISNEYQNSHVIISKESDKYIITLTDNTDEFTFTLLINAIITGDPQNNGPKTIVVEYNVNIDKPRSFQINQYSNIERRNKVSLKNRYTNLKKYFKLKRNKTLSRDLSFEDRLLSHNEEMLSLGEYYISHPDYDYVPQVFLSFNKFFSDDAIEQLQYMEENNITFEDLRTNEEVQELFKFTNEEFNRIRNLYYIVKNDVSEQLLEDLHLSVEYYDLCVKTNYTKLEIFKDATGYEDPNQYQADGNSKKFNSKIKKKELDKIVANRNGKGGIGAREAIAKLQAIFDEMQGELNIPVEFGLKQNYPNPFNPETNIEYSLQSNSNVSLIIYNILGEEVRKLINNKEIEKGIHKIKWDGKDNFGGILSSGTYIYMLKAGKFTDRKLMLLTK